MSSYRHFVSNLGFMFLIMIIFSKLLGTVGWEGSEVVIFDRGLCLFDGRVEEE